jgi:uncharacterized membrane protein
MLESLFAFFFKYRPSVFAQGDLAFGSPASVIGLLLVAAALGVPAVLTYTRVRGKSTIRDRWVLGALRVGAIVVLMVCLFRPMLLLSAAVPQRNFVGVLIDDSRSMQIADVDGKPRSDFVRHLAGAPDSTLLKQLAERFQLRFFRFGNDVERIARPESVSFAAGGTHLGTAITHAREELSSVPLSGLVVLTDGADNARTAMADQLLSLRAGAVPVFTVGLGREKYEKEIEIRRVEAPRTALKGSALVVDLQVRQRGYRGEKVPLVVEDEGRVIDRQEITLPEGSDAAPVRVHVTAGAPGPRTLTFRIPAQPGEMVTQNNAQQALVVVRDTREKILYIEGEPRYELGYIRRAVMADSNLQLVSLVRTAENKFLRMDVDSAGELAGGFPKTRDELFGYRAVILGNIEASFFTHDQLSMLADFVSMRGGGLLALGGRQAFAEGGYTGTPLAEALPVVVEGQAVPDSLTFLADLEARVTPAGASHAAVQVEQTEQASVERWRKMPWVTSVNRIRRLKPGAVALITGVVPEDGRSGTPGEAVRGYEQPILAYQRYGRGLAVALPIQDSWVWKMHADVPVEDMSFETFWRQLLRWLISDVPGRVMVTVANDQVAPRQPVTLQAVVADAGFTRLNDARVVAHVTAPSGASRDVAMDWAVDRDGEYRATFTPDEEGRYTIKVDAGTPQTPVTVSAEPAFVRVAPQETEYFDSEMRGSLLRRVSEETGGRFYTPSTVSRLPEDLTLSKRGVTVVNQMDLWDMPIVFLLLVGLVSGEWAYRKARGLA